MKYYLLVFYAAIIIYLPRYSLQTNPELFVIGSDDIQFKEDSISIYILTSIVDLETKTGPDKVRNARTDQFIIINIKNDTGYDKKIIETEKGFIDYDSFFEKLSRVIFINPSSYVNIHYELKWNKTHNVTGIYISKSEICVGGDVPVCIKFEFKKDKNLRDFFNFVNSNHLGDPCSLLL